MATVKVNKDSLKGAEPHPEGIYEFRCDGFKPSFSKDRESINLNPQLKIVSHLTLNGKAIWCNLNTKAGWIMDAFVKSLGMEMVITGNDAALPGDFNGPDEDPKAWQYVGPLVGKVGKVKLIVVDNTKGKTKNDVEFLPHPSIKQ